MSRENPVIWVVDHIQGLHDWFLWFLHRATQKEIDRRKADKPHTVEISGIEFDV